MAEPFVGEIRMFAGNFAPRAWALCNGQLMSIAQNTALFSLLGTQFGGDGKVTFGLPNLQAAVPMNQGQGPGLTDRVIGELGGEVNYTLQSNEMPAHIHSYSGEGVQATATSPVSNLPASNRSVSPYTPANAPGIVTALMSPQALSPAGSSTPHNNQQPYLVITFIIALQGVFPSRQ